ncbi:MAG TPA: tryptophan 7-halogenase [Rhizomicrobium sp.]|nr:tryptophan 7-halogenase [Rhizomicrobium sp.]
MTTFDILIAGGGPAGCAAAIALGLHAPELSVCIAHAPRGDAVTLGETLPPPAAAMLKQLGVYETFVADGHERAFRTVSAWGSAKPAANEFLGHVHQHGWRLDRPRFDEMLRTRALETGAHWTRARITGLAQGDAGWTAQCDGAAPIAARFAIDATGRGAALLRLLPCMPRPETLDRLIACIVHFENCASPHADTSVESFEDGWWFATGLPCGKRLVALMSDSDIVRRLRAADPNVWHGRLQETQLTRRLVQDGHPCGPPRLVPAGSRYQAAPSGLPLLAAGDAASSFDPLSSQGIVKALRSGAFAAYAAADFLKSGDARNLARYRAFVDGEFAAYRRTWREHYRHEARWRERAFWRRRFLD